MNIDLFIERAIQSLTECLHDRSNAEIVSMAEPDYDSLSDEARAVFNWRYESEYPVEEWETAEGSYVRYEMKERETFDLSENSLGAIAECLVCELDNYPTPDRDERRWIRGLAQSLATRLAEAPGNYKDRQRHWPASVSASTPQTATTLAPARASIG